MADVYISNGYTYTNDIDFSLKTNDKDFYLQALEYKEVCVYGADSELTPITYEKFMDLFAEPKHTTFDEFYEKEKERINNLGSTQPHYDNTKGSIYKFCNDQKLNSWEFDIIKRVVRCRKKGQFKEDLQKTKDLIDLYLKEFTDETKS